MESGLIWSSAPPLTPHSEIFSESLRLYFWMQLSCGMGKAKHFDK